MWIVAEAADGSSPSAISPEGFDRAEEHLPKLRHVELERRKGVTAFRRFAAKIADRHAGRQGS